MNSLLNKSRALNQQMNDMSNDAEMKGVQEVPATETPKGKPNTVKEARPAAKNNNTRVQSEVKSEIETRAQKKQRLLE